jgi:hypothetical protein
MTPASLLADLRHDGIELQTDGTRLRWRPAFMVSQPRASALLACKVEIIHLLMKPELAECARCPSCRRYLTAKGQCWTCCDRRCACGGMTGSAFIERCQQCSVI